MHIWHTDVYLCEIWRDTHFGFLLNSSLFLQVSYSRIVLFIKHHFYELRDLSIPQKRSPFFLQWGEEGHKYPLPEPYYHHSSSITQCKKHQRDVLGAGETLEHSAQALTLLSDLHRCWQNDRRRQAVFWSQLSVLCLSFSPSPLSVHSHHLLSLWQHCKITIWERSQVPVDKRQRRYLSHMHPMAGWTQTQGSGIGKRSQTNKNSLSTGKR